ncbi:UNVERIFIED_CONTAM: hypothetical protein HDU68_011954 [Siphonaria sp. JEL0065]|nr:hypothetical protein HDU68_011954 [Siphonaria sp. JEL0065]
MITPYPTPFSVDPLLFEKEPKQWYPTWATNHQIQAVLPPDLLQLVSCTTQSLSAEQRARVAVVLSFINSPREFSNYRVQSIIGYGTNGVVMSALNESGSIVAIKVIYKQSPGTFHSSIPSEIRSVKELNNHVQGEHILKYIHDWQDASHFYLVTEKFGSEWLSVLHAKQKPLVFQTVDQFGKLLQSHSFSVYPGGCDAWAWSTVLKKYLLKTRQSDVLPMDAVKQIIHQSAKALCGIHRAGYFHGDVKLENILLQAVSGGCGGAESLWVKLADFGTTKRIKLGNEGKADVLDLGRVLSLLLSENREPDSANSLAFALMAEMCQSRVQERLDMEQVLLHPWFK